jgi:hypothetical protein
MPVSTLFVDFDFSDVVLKKGYAFFGTIDFMEWKGSAICFEDFFKDMTFTRSVHGGKVSHLMENNTLAAVLRRSDGNVGAMHLTGPTRLIDEAKAIPLGQLHAMLQAKVEAEAIPLGKLRHAMLQAKVKAEVKVEATRRLK